ncbi:MAG TPA: hypothetical protein VF306_09505 [Pirellulales bacterium]
MHDAKVGLPATEAVTHEALTQLYQTLSRMGRKANQGEVGVVIDGKYYGITEYEVTSHAD